VKARIPHSGRELTVDLTRGVSLAIALDFDAPQPRHFGAPRASAQPFALPGFSGSVATGASCNCSVVTLIPHCHGTHTECVGHLTRERHDAWRVVPLGLIPALLVSASPERAADSAEGTEPLPAPGDLLITAGALERAWPATLPFEPQALVIRTLPNTADKRTRDYSGLVPPYLSREAAELLLVRGIVHLVVDVPSIDRTHDQGKLTAHRLFFGLAPGETGLDAARRAAATVTELAFVPNELADGAYLLELQVPELAGDAVPSRPLLYPLHG
jgi:arylformamidase